MGWKFWERPKSAAEVSLEQLQAGTASPGPAPSGGFAMPVEDVFSITGRGTVVTGTVRQGTVRVGQQVRVGSRTTTVTGIEAFRKLLESASTGDNVGLLLKGVSRDDVSRGDVVTG